MIRQLRPLLARFGRAPRLAAAALLLVLAALSAVGAQAAPPTAPAAAAPPPSLTPGPDAVAVSVTLSDGGAGRYFLHAGQRGDLVLAARSEADGGVTITSRIHNVRILSISSQTQQPTGGIADDIGAITTGGTSLTVAVPVADVAGVAQVNAVVLFTARPK